MPYDEYHVGEQMMEVKIKNTWYGDILRKPGIHLIPIEWRYKLPKTAKVLSILGESEFEEDKGNDEEEITRHAHKMKPLPLSELAKSQAKSSADKKPKRHYRRKTKKD